MEGLSKNEQEFVERFKSEIIVEKKQKEEKTSKNFKKRKFGFLKPSYWFAALAAFPVLIGLMFVLLIAQAKTYLGSSFDWLMENGNQGAAKNIANMANFNWIPGLATIYQERFLIASILTTLFVIFVVIAILVNTLSKKEVNNESKE